MLASKAFDSAARSAPDVIPAGDDASPPSTPGTSRRLTSCASFCGVVDVPVQVATPRAMPLRLGLRVLHWFRIVTRA